MGALKGMPRAPTGPRKGAGRPKKPPGAPVDHRLSDAMKAAIDVMVTDNLSRKDAAEKAGISDDAIRKAMEENPLARRYYEDQVRSFVQCLRHEAAHALRNELKGRTPRRALRPPGRCSATTWSRHHRKRRRRPVSQSSLSSGPKGCHWPGQ